MNILDRIRVAFLRRELVALESADRAARDQAQTTGDMMEAIVERASKIVALQNRIAVLTGDVDDDEDIDFGPRLPSSMGAPSTRFQDSRP